MSLPEFVYHDPNRPLKRPPLDLREKDSSSVRDPTSPRSGLQGSHVSSPELICPPLRLLERPPHQTRGGQFMKPPSKDSSPVRDPMSPRSFVLQGSHVSSPGGGSRHRGGPSRINCLIILSIFSVRIL